MALHEQGNFTGVQKQGAMGRSLTLSHHFNGDVPLAVEIGGARVAKLQS